MYAFFKILKMEARLSLRDVAPVVTAVVLPTVIMVVLGAVPALRRPDDVFGGQRFVDVFAPSLLVVTLVMAGLNGLTNALAGYRERGVLRRLSTTPVSPGALLAAQLLIHLALAACGAVLLVVVGRVLFGIPLPARPFVFALAFLLGAASLFAVGLLIAASAPTTGTANGLSSLLGALVMFLGGVYLPRYLLPDVLVRVGDLTPPGVRTLQDAWTGASPELLPLAIMAAVAAAAGIAAARFFRWE
ncbi:ABC transporter permease [Micromonospora sp. NPDC049559]|uniref:ABC transporter permease n=1 Tax=Micromonospora sp. NPDC049559 TaxID=3155923 RepID=UPI00343BCEBE